MFENEMEAKTKFLQWEEELRKALAGGSRPTPTVTTQNDLQDALEIFGGKELKKKVILRTRHEVRQGDDIVLKQFDPSFHSPDTIKCRAPGCSEFKYRSKALGTASVKEDLFLCLNHRGKMTEYIRELCARQKVEVYTGLHGDCHGYLSLIGLMERAYVCSCTNSKDAPQILKNSPLIVKEVFLNVRNYFMITNALLNPNGDNVGFVIPPVYEILDRIIEALRRGTEFVRALEDLVRLLGDVINTILQTFGILYRWVTAQWNLGARIGGGLGGGVGLAAGGAAAGAAVGLATGGLGLVCGALIGGGVYQWWDSRSEDRRRRDALRQYREFLGDAPGPEVVYYYEGNDAGDLHAMAMPVAPAA